MAEEKLKMQETEKEEDQEEEEDVPSYGFGVRHLQMLSMTLCATVIYVMRSSMSVAILPMTDSSIDTVETYVWSEKTKGVIQSSFFWGYVIMQVPAGILTKTFGGKPIMLVALIINALLCAVTPLAARIGDWMAVCAVRVAMGLSQACFMPGQHTLIGQWAPAQERNRFSIIAYAGIQIGTILTMPVCGILSSTSLGWHLIFYTMAVLSLIMAFLWWALTASSPAQHRLIKAEEVAYIESSLASSNEVQMDIPWRKILRCVPLYAIAAAHVGLNWCFVIFLTETPTYLRDALKFNIKESGALSALPHMSQWAVSICCSFVADYLYNSQKLTTSQSRKLFNSIGAFGSGIGLICLSFIGTDNLVLAVGILCFSVGMLGACTCGYMLNHIDLSPRYSGVMFGLTNCVANVVGLLGPLTTGYITEGDASNPAKWRIVFCLAAGIFMTSDIIYRVFGSSTRQVWDERRRSSVYSLGHFKRQSLRRASTNNERHYSFTKTDVQKTTTD